MKNATTSIKGLLSIIIILISSFSFTASANDANTKSQVAVESTETKTKISVSNFPTKTTIVICDADYNLLSVVSTDNVGSAIINLSTSVKTAITAKTLNGEVVVTLQPSVVSQNATSNTK